jgi:hypothetical protein
LEFSGCFSGSFAWFVSAVWVKVGDIALVFDSGSSSLGVSPNLVGEEADVDGEVEAGETAGGCVSMLILMWYINIDVNIDNRS